MSQISQLYKLQLNDTELLTTKKKLMIVLEELKDSAELDAAKIAVEDAQVALSKCKTKQTDNELQLGSLKDKMIQSEQLLYSGKVKDSREVSDLKASVDSMKRQIDPLEEDTFASLEATDNAQNLLATATEHLANAQGSYDSRQAKLNTKKGELALALNGFMEKRKTQRAALPDTLVQSYDKIFKSKKGLAVVVAKNGVCGGCRTSMSAKLAVQVERGELVTCSSCTRMLIHR